MAGERPYTGLTASIWFGTGATADQRLAYISGLDLTIEKDIIDILQFGSQYREKVPSIKNWSASLDGTVAFAPGMSQHQLYMAFEGSNMLQIATRLDPSTMFIGQAYVENFNVSSAPDAATTVSCSLQGTGGLIFDLNTAIAGIVNPLAITGKATVAIAPQSTSIAIVGTNLNGALTNAIPTPAPGTGVGPGPGGTFPVIDLDVSAWFTGLATGLTAKASWLPNSSSIIVTFGGTAAAAAALTQIVTAIPATALISGAALTIPAATTFTCEIVT